MGTGNWQDLVFRKLRLRNLPNGMLIYIQFSLTPRHALEVCSSAASIIPVPRVPTANQLCPIIQSQPRRVSEQSEPICWLTKPLAQYRTCFQASQPAIVPAKPPCSKPPCPRQAPSSLGSRLHCGRVDCRLLAIRLPSPLRPRALRLPHGRAGHLAPVLVHATAEPDLIVGLGK